MIDKITQQTKLIQLLIIEDSKVDAYLIKKTLKKHMQGIENIEHAEDMASAEHILANNDAINIILSDLGLPDTNGEEDTFSRIKNITTEIPVIILTSQDNHDLAMNIIKNGAEDYIKKSNISKNPEGLCDAIEFAICRHENSEEVKHLKDLAVKEKDAMLDLISGGYSVTKN